MTPLVGTPQPLWKFVLARPDIATNLLQTLIPATINSLKCVKKGNLHFSYVLEDGLLGKYLVITPRKSELKNHHRKFCLSEQKVFMHQSIESLGGGGRDMRGYCSGKNQ